MKTSLIILAIIALFTFVFINRYSKKEESPEEYTELKDKPVICNNCGRTLIGDTSLPHECGVEYLPTAIGNRSLSHIPMGNTSVVGYSNTYLVNDPDGILSKGMKGTGWFQIHYSNDCERRVIGVTKVR